MNDQPTPGPWQWDVTPRCTRLVGADAQPVLLVIDWGSGFQTFGARRSKIGPLAEIVPLKPELPDARLIAAAPLLLAEAVPAQAQMLHAANLLDAFHERLPKELLDTQVRLAWQAGRLAAACLRAAEGGIG